MLKQLFDSVRDLSAKADKVEIVQNVPKNVIALRDGADIRFLPAPPHPRHNKPLSIKTVVELVERYVGDRDAEIWYSRSGITAVLDSESRWDKAEFRLCMSEQMAALANMAANKPMVSQKQLVLSLRTTFHDCMNACPEFLPIARKLKWNTTHDSGGDLQHGKISVGQSIRSQVEGTAAIPEYVTFSVPVFGNLVQDPASVTCAVEVYPDSRNFQLIPLPRSIDNAIRDGERQIADTLKAEITSKNVAVYYGEP